MTVSNKLTTTLLAVAALACVESSARANIVAVATLSGSAVGLTVQTPLPGTTITGNFIHNNGLPDGIAFAEKQNFTLASSLALDTGGVLAAGTRVSSYFVGFDTGGASLHQHTSATFSAAILGIEYVDGGNLGASDVLGLSTLNYNLGCGLCGYEGGETATFAGPTATFTSTFSNPGDYARVITAAVPEPATWALMLIGFATAGVALRGSRRSGRVVTA